MKETFYFSHDYNARNDQKVLILRGDFGPTGYALFFMMLESMAEETDGYIHRGAIGGLSVSYSVAKDLLQEFINKCIEIGLFVEDDIGIYSKRMLEHKNYRKSLSEQGKVGAEKRWKNSPPISPPNAKERKGKERKLKETDTNTCVSFDKFWNLYPRKIGKPDAIKKYKPILEEEILRGLEAWKQYWEDSETEPRYVPHPATWLNQERWKDEVPDMKPKTLVLTNNF